MNLKPCVFCDGLKNKFSDIQIYYNIQDDIKLFETENFEVIPDKFPISDNHIIIIPKHHINTFSEFDKLKDVEIETILDRLQFVVKSDNYIMFEHGTCKKDEENTNPVMKSIFHAHLHFIPNVVCNTSDIDNFFYTKNIQLLFKNSKYNIYDFETSYNSNFNNFIRKNLVYEKNNQVQSYFFIKNSDNTQLFLPENIITPKLPSQFLREVVSNKTGTFEWNWKIKISLNAYQQYRKRIIKMINLFKQNNIFQDLYFIKYKKR